MENSNSYNCTISNWNYEEEKKDVIATKIIIAQDFATLIDKINKFINGRPARIDELKQEDEYFYCIVNILSTPIQTIKWIPQPYYPYPYTPIYPDPYPYPYKPYQPIWKYEPQKWTQPTQIWCNTKTVNGETAGLVSITYDNVEYKIGE